MIGFVSRVVVASVAVSLLCAAPAVANPDQPAPPGPMINPVEPPSVPYSQPGSCEFQAGDGSATSCASEPTDDLGFGFFF